MGMIMSPCNQGPANYYYYYTQVTSLAELKRETVSQIEKTGPFDCCCNRQSVALPCLCLRQGPRWISGTHFVIVSLF